MVLMMGRATVRIADVSCGNLVAVVCVDQFPFKVGHFDVHRRCAQHCGHDVQRLSRREGGFETEGRTGPAEVGRGFEEALEVGSGGGVHHRGEWRHVIVGCGELRVVNCLKDLREEYAQ